MYLPTVKQLDAANDVAVHLEDKFEQALQKLIGNTDGLIHSYMAILGSNFEVALPDATNGESSAEKLKGVLGMASEVMQIDKRARSAVRSALLHGIEVGLAVNDLSSGPPEITEHTMSRAALEFSLAIRDEKLDLIASYDQMVKTQSFMTLLMMGYGLLKGKPIANLDDLSVLKEQILAEPELLRGMGMSLVLGLLTGVRLRADAPKKTEKPETDAPVRGGWR